jgi:hypothetical protein
MTEKTTTLDAYRLCMLTLLPAITSMPNVGWMSENPSPMQSGKKDLTMELPASQAHAS